MFGFINRVNKVIWPRQRYSSAHVSSLRPSSAIYLINSVDKTKHVVINFFRLHRAGKVWIDNIENTRYSLTNPPIKLACQRLFLRQRIFLILEG